MITDKKFKHILLISISLTTIIPILVVLYLIKSDVLLADAVLNPIPVIIVITLFMVFIGIFILSKISKAISTLSKSAHSLAKGDLAQYSPPPTEYVKKSSSEVTSIAESLNLITEQLILNVDELESKAILLERSNRQLERLNEKKTTFVSTTTHELRAPLINIKQCVSLLLENPNEQLSTNQKEGLIMIKNNSERLIRMIADLLDVSKLDSAQMCVEKMDIIKVVKEAVTTVDHWCTNKGISLYLKLPHEEIIVYGDSDRVRQVFTNLLSNAIKYTPPRGKIELLYKQCNKVVDSEASGSKEMKKFAAISVKDNGIGIAEADLKEIFKRFVKVENPDYTQGFQSAGLGLSIAQEIVEMHGGSINVESKPGKGSIFTVTLPLFTDESK